MVKQRDKISEKLAILETPISSGCFPHAAVGILTDIVRQGNLSPDDFASKAISLILSEQTETDLIEAFKRVLFGALSLEYDGRSFLQIIRRELDNYHINSTSIDNVLEEFGVEYWGLRKDSIPIPSTPQSMEPIAGGEPGTMVVSESIDALSLLRTSDVVALVFGDVHFGRFHCRIEGVVVDPPEALLSCLKRAPNDLKPHFCIICGDLTSGGTKHDKEYEETKAFLQRLVEQDVFRDDKLLDRSERVLIVPGNHEVKWLDDLNTDHLESFEKFVRNLQAFSPYGPERSTKTVECVCEIGSDLPAFALVHFRGYDISVGLLSTAHFSGDNQKAENEEIRRKISSLMAETDGDTRHILEEIIRFDQGFVPGAYAARMIRVNQRMLGKIGGGTVMGMKVAICHHPLTMCGSTFPAGNANLIRTTLRSDLNIPLVLHGHAHRVERQIDGPGSTRAMVVAAPTLSACDQVDGLGLLILCFKRSTREYSIILWRFDSEGRFALTKKDLDVLWRGSID